MLILGIETTCDETGAAVVMDGRKVLSNVVASSVDLQKKYGGVVPEVAAREQVRVIIPVIREALSGYSPSDVDAIAVAYGPGLIGSLLIGVETAKATALAWDKPLIAVNHLVGHIYANFVGEISKIKNQKSKIEFPLIALIVSGGHTDLVLMTGHGKYKLLGSTLDDAAGEAFDKVAKLLGLGYPGGPEIELLARQLTVNSSQSTVKLPRPMISQRDFSAKGGPVYGWDFSFSGLKTAVVNLVNQQNYSSSDPERSEGESRSSRPFDQAQGKQARIIMDDLKAEIAYEFQMAAVDVLVTKTLRAALKFGAKSVVVGGGVAANDLLRERLTVDGSQIGIPIFFPQKNLSIDNGAMIAAAAFFNFTKIDPLKLSADPSLHF